MADVAAASRQGNDGSSGGRSVERGEARREAAQGGRGEERVESGRSALRMHLWQGVNALVDTAVLEGVLARVFSSRSFARRRSCESAQEGSEADRPEDRNG